MPAVQATRNRVSWMWLRAKVKKVRARRCSRSTASPSRRAAGPNRASWARMSAAPMMFWPRTGRNDKG